MEKVHTAAKLSFSTLFKIKWVYTKDIEITWKGGQLLLYGIELYKGAPSEKCIPGKGCTPPPHTHTHTALMNAFQ